MTICQRPIETFESVAAFRKTMQRECEVQSPNAAGAVLCAGGAGIRVSLEAYSGDGFVQAIRILEGVYTFSFNGSWANAEEFFGDAQSPKSGAKLLRIRHISKGSHELVLDNQGHSLYCHEWVLYQSEPNSQVNFTPPVGSNLVFSETVLTEKGLRNALGHFSFKMPQLLSHVQHGANNCFLHITDNSLPAPHYLYDEDVADDIRRAELIRHRFGEILLRLDTNEMSGKQNLAGRLSLRDIRGIDMACEIIDENIQSPPSLDELTSATGVNRTKLAEGFRILHNKTMTRYRTEKRLERAQRLLLQSDLSVSEIAFETGYSNPANLTRVFTSFYGLSPRAMRRRATASI